MGKAEARESVLVPPPVPLAASPGASSLAAGEQLPVAARRCPSLPAAHALSPQSWTAALPARGAGTGAESPLWDPGCSTAGEGQTPVPPPGWGSSLPGGEEACVGLAFSG